MAILYNQCFIKLIKLKCGKKFNKAQFAKAEINLSEIMSKILDGYFFPYEAFKRLRCIPTKTYSLLSFLPTVFSYYSRSAQKLHCKSCILCVKKTLQNPQSSCLFSIFGKLSYYILYAFERLC